MDYTDLLDGRMTLAVLFASCLVIGNITATKVMAIDLPVLGSVAAPAGFVAIGIAFLFSDLTVEWYGRAAAHEMVNATIVALVVGWTFVLLAIQFPAAPFYDLQSEYAAVLWDSTTIVTASVITLALSQHIDVGLFAAIRDQTGFGHRYARNIGSTATSQLLDTTVFIVLGFTVLPVVLGGEVTPLSAIPSLIATQYLLKLIVAVGETPLFYAATTLRRQEVTA